MTKLLLTTSIALLLLFQLNWAADVLLTVNADATVTFKSGSNETTAEVTADKQKSITLSWLTDESNVTISVVSKNAGFSDTTFTQTINSGSAWPAWDASAEYPQTDTVSHNGKVWANSWWANPGEEPGQNGVWKEINAPGNAAITIILSEKEIEYSEDSAYILFESNVDAILTATALTLIEGDLPSSPFTFNLKGKEPQTILLPVKTTGTPITIPNKKEGKAIFLTQNNNNISLTIPTSYLNGSLHLYSVSGREVGNMKFSSSVQNSLSLWNTASGVYLLRLRGDNGAEYTQKVSSSGGNMRIVASYTDQSVVERTASTAKSLRASEAIYRFKVKPNDGEYNDTTFEVSLQPKKNEDRNVYLINPDDTVNVNFEELLDSLTYEELFLHRYGKDPDYAGQQPGGDFFTYTAFREAIEKLANKKVTIYRKDGLGYGEKVTVTDKSTGKSHTYITTSDYPGHTGSEYTIDLDYGSFLAIGSMETKKLELAAFLGNISHETTGGWETAPDGRYAWGLFYKEEAGMNDNSVGGYVVQHDIYPPVTGQSYHGRGPKQLSYNTNYGQFSEFVYFDKQILLDNPKIVSNDPVISFMSALWFWMTPQGRKPSCHEVMTDLWVPTAEDSAAGRHLSKFGMTVNIINGGLECGGSDGDSRVVDRIGYYKRYADLMEETTENYCDCGQIRPY